MAIARKVQRGRLLPLLFVVVVTVLWIFALRADKDPVVLHFDGGDGGVVYEFPFVMPETAPEKIIEVIDKGGAEIGVKSLAEFDEEWLQAMRNAKFINIEVERFRKGFSWKFRGQLEGGYKVVLKPIFDFGKDIRGEGIEDRSDWDVVDIFSDEAREKFWRNDTAPRVSRMGRDNQGFAEIAGYHLDRVLGLNIICTNTLSDNANKENFRKAPMMGRMLDNHEFYKFEPTKSRMRNLPTFDMPMALIPWIRGMRYDFPPWNGIGDVLKMHTAWPSSVIRQKQILDVSTVIVYDFIIDNHDRHGSHNWMSGLGFGSLTWDDGLSYLHGPMLRDDICKIQLMCGPQDWREKEVGSTDKECFPICRFHKPFIEKLRTVGPGAPPNRRLSYLFKKHCESDPLFPLFHMGDFRVRRSGAAKRDTSHVHIQPDNFFLGIDIKVEQALNIVNECVRKYGEAKVLMDIGQSEVAAKKGSRRPARTRNATHAARKGA